MRRTYSILVVLLLAAPLLAQTVEQLKAEADRAGSNQAKASAEVAEQLVPMADKQFSEGQSVIGHQTVEEILKYATQARDLAVKNRKKMKETEIHLRRCRYALENMRRTLAAEDRPPVEAVEKKLEQFGEDILEAMFAPPKKEQK
jgi:hypothetical protein